MEDRQTFSEMAECVTHETLPELFTLLRNRPKPHDPEYETLILKTVAETLGTTLWKVFLEYQDAIGEKLSNLTELAWQKSYPDFYNLKFMESEQGIILNFPEDRIQKRKRGRKSIDKKLNNIQALSTKRHEI